MKKHLKALYLNSMFALLACSLMLTSSCKKDEKAIDDVAAETATINEKAISYLVDKGFDKNRVVFEKDRVIVEDDIIFTNADLDQRLAEAESSGDSNSPQTEHYRSDFLVGNAYNTNIKIWIDPGVPAAWKTAIQGAVNNWNSITATKIGMSIVSTQAAAHCKVYMGFEDANWVARAYLPGSDRKPGFSCEINSKFNSMAANQKLFAITHEFGHTIGFYHTNQNTGVFIKGSTVTDAKSVMNSWVLPWAGFTKGDVQATRIIYPAN